MKNSFAFLSLVLGAAVGCAGPSTATATRSVKSAAKADRPQGSKFVCHLLCLGKHRKAYGLTPEEARAKLRKLVGESCKPRDHAEASRHGQYFTFCNPIK